MSESLCLLELPVFVLLLRFWVRCILVCCFFGAVKTAFAAHKPQSSNFSQGCYGTQIRRHGDGFPPLGGLVHLAFGCNDL